MYASSTTTTTTRLSSLDSSLLTEEGIQEILTTTNDLLKMKTSASFSSSASSISSASSSSSASIRVSTRPSTSLRATSKRIMIMAAEASAATPPSSSNKKNKRRVSKCIGECDHNEPYTHDFLHCKKCKLDVRRCDQPQCPCMGSGMLIATERTHIYRHQFPGESRAIKVQANKKAEFASRVMTRMIRSRPLSRQICFIAAPDGSGQIDTQELENYRDQRRQWLPETNQGVRHNFNAPIQRQIMNSSARPAPGSSASEIGDIVDSKKIQAFLSRLPFQMVGFPLDLPSQNSKDSGTSNMTTNQKRQRIL
jgi:hypothetical protein